MSVYGLLLGDDQRANELTQWEPCEMFSVWLVLTNSETGFSMGSVRRLCNATLAIFGVNPVWRRGRIPPP
jgi:hypothetical protein